MDKNQPFFDPYNFNMPPTMGHGPMPQPDMPAMGLESPVNPSMYYEQQYMYYRYLTQLLEYKIKMKEWEKLNMPNK